MSVIIFANLPDGLNPFSLFDEAFNPTSYTVTSGNYTTTGGDNRIVVNKTSGSPTAILMDTAETMENLEIWIKDGKGDASTNNITITDSSGATFDGQASLVISSDYGSYWVKSVAGNWLTM